MQQPSLYSHFASKNAIYDAMFEQAWRAFLDHVKGMTAGLPAEPRERLTAIAEDYFDYAVADLARHQLMDENIILGFQPSPEAYAPAVETYGLMQQELRSMGVTSGQDADIYTALIAGPGAGATPTGTVRWTVSGTAGTTACTSSVTRKRWSSSGETYPGAVSSRATNVLQCCQ